MDALCSGLLLGVPHSTMTISAAHQVTGDSLHSHNPPRPHLQRLNTDLAFQRRAEDTRIHHSAQEVSSFSGWHWSSTPPCIDSSLLLGGSHSRSHSMPSLSPQSPCLSSLLHGRLPSPASPVSPTDPLLSSEVEEIFDTEDAWNLIPYNIPWGPSYVGYELGSLPGPEGTSIFLRSPTPLKYQRTEQACEKCRERKAKCSGTKPSCARCTARGQECVYGLDVKRTKSAAKNAHRVTIKVENDDDEARNALHSPQICHAKLPCLSLHSRDQKPLVASKICTNRKAAIPKMMLTGLVTPPQSPTFLIETGGKQNMYNFAPSVPSPSMSICSTMSMSSMSGSGSASGRNASAEYYGLGLESPSNFGYDDLHPGPILDINYGQDLDYPRHLHNLSISQLHKDNVFMLSSYSDSDSASLYPLPSPVLDSIPIHAPLPPPYVHRVAGINTFRSLDEGESHHMDVGAESLHPKEEHIEREETKLLYPHLSQSPNRTDIPEVGLHTFEDHIQAPSPLRFNSMLSLTAPSIAPLHALLTDSGGRAEMDAAPIRPFLGPSYGYHASHIGDANASAAMMDGASEQPPSHSSLPIPFHMTEEDHPSANASFSHEFSTSTLPHLRPYVHSMMDSDLSPLHLGGDIDDLNYGMFNMRSPNLFAANEVNIKHALPKSDIYAYEGSQSYASNIDSLPSSSYTRNDSGALYSGIFLDSPVPHNISMSRMSSTPDVSMPVYPLSSGFECH